MGEVPILEVGDRKLTQSAAILLYLADKHGAYGGQDRRRAPGSPALDVLRQPQVHQLLGDLAFPEVVCDRRRRIPCIEKWLRGRIDNAFGIVEKHLANREYLVGTQPTIADMSMCGYLYFPPEESGYDIAKQYPAMAQWLERLKKLPGWKPPYELLPGEVVKPRW